MVAALFLHVALAIQAVAPQASPSPPSQVSPPPPPLTGTIRVTASRLPDGRWSVWDIPIDRARSLPRWNPEAAAPPVPAAEAIRLGRNWLTTRNPQLGRLDLQTIGMSRIRRGVDVDTWCYQIDFFAYGPTEPSSPLMRAVVLLDGSVMDPRVEPAAAAQTTPPAEGVYDIRTPGVVPPRVLGEARPQYRAEAMRQKIEGSVLVECVVSVGGKAGDCRVVRSLDPLYGLDEEALKAAAQWRFTPGTKDGQPVPVRVTMEMTFTMRK